MDSSASPEPILQQVEPLKKELKECKKTKEHLQYSELKYRNLVESANEAILVAQNGIFQYAINMQILRPKRFLDIHKRK
jgi:hypothetical protein